MQLSSLNPFAILSRYSTSKNEANASQALIPPSIVSTVQEIGNDVLSEFANYLFYASWSNPTLGKLVGGTICTTVGTHYLIKSQITQRLFRWFNQAHAEENKRASREEALLFTASMAITIYGVYNIATGVLELFSSDESNKESLTSTAIHAPTNPIYPTKCEPNEEIVSAREVLNDILDCPNSVAVLEEIRQRGEGKVNIKDLVGEGEKYRDFHGMWTSSQRTIYVKGSLCHRNKLATMLYEFLNANRTKDYDKIDGKALAGKLCREDYTRKLEEIGYANRVSHHKIVEACVQNSDWDPRVDIYGLMVERYKDFKSFWKAVIDSPHSNLYRDQWNQLFKEKYCKRHRRASECQEETNPQYELSSHLTFKDEL